MNSVLAISTAQDQSEDSPRKHRMAGAALKIRDVRRGVATDWCLTGAWFDSTGHEASHVTPIRLTSGSGREVNMETDTNKRVIEINGIKMEVDLRHAKRIDEFRVGCRVKLLKKSYGDSFSVHMGVIVSFDEFIQRPSIVVAYISDSFSDGGLKFATINKDTKDFEIAPAYESDLEFSKADILAQMDRAIEVEKVKLYDLEERRRYFLANFGKFFNSEQENIPAVEHTEAQ